MANVNISKVYLLSVPLENDYKNTLYFTTLAKQQEYFQSRIVRRFTDFSYQRKDNKIRVPNTDAMGLNSNFDDLLNAGINYVMYQNSAYSDKWFYAFIKDIEYIDDNRTDIMIETDVLQTWMFRYTVKPSFIEREHVSDDTIGRHTVPENLEFGDYTCNRHTTDSAMDELFQDMCYILAATCKYTNNGEDKGDPATGKTYNGIYSGCAYYRFDSASTINIVLDLYAQHGQSDAIVGIFMIPKFLAPLDESATEKEVATSGSAKSYDVSLDKNNTLGGYAPQNNKLLCYPYNYLLASNNNGANAIYQYEMFKNNNCEFTVKGALCPGGSIRLTPKNYKGITENDEESINLGKYPICSYATDMYTNWLTQNSVNIAGMKINADQMNIAGSAISGIMQVASGIGLMATGAGALAGVGAVAGGITSGIAGVSNAVMQQKQHELTPPQANGNINCGDVITASSKNTFHFYQMSIKEEYARIVDNYFHMFGYKVNRVKLPNKAHRSRFWYTKTIDVNIDGAIPQNDLQIIKNCYNNGITFWRNASEIQNYALSNAIAITDGAVTE